MPRCRNSYVVAGRLGEEGDEDENDEDHGDLVVYCRQRYQSSSAGATGEARFPRPGLFSRWDLAVDRARRTDALTRGAGAVGEDHALAGTAHVHGGGGLRDGEPAAREALGGGRMGTGVGTAAAQDGEDLILVYGVRN